MTKKLPDEWTTSDGRTLEKIKDMDDSHLLNTMRYIESINFVFEKFVSGAGSFAEEMWADIEEN